MTAITAAMVKDLRLKTGAGMMECKKALVEAGGDVDKAIESMRKAGQAKAVKKSSRVAAEGIVLVEVSEDSKCAIILEVNCETDFVARDKTFLGFARLVAQKLLATGQIDFEQVPSIKLDSGETIEEARKSLIAKLGENINIRRMEFFSSNNCLAAYVHGDRIGVVVELSKEKSELARDIAMHVAATSPLVVQPADVPQSEVDKEKAIFIAQAEQSGKPADIIEKMVAGRMRKFLDEVSLLGQEFVKDPSKKVSDLLKEFDAEVTRFVRYAVGEGIEKQESDFVKEVMEQAGAGKT